MTIIFKNLTLKNFLSIGNVTQSIDFENKNLTLILGENMDMGGDGARNGVGKTAILQGLSYALFGSPINQIKKDNLINRTNSKNMVATIEFSVNDVNYKIIRGRKPNILKFFVNDKEQSNSDNDAQGENKETQASIERILSMSGDLFPHIVGLNSYTTPFLSMRVGEQRPIIEQLLGITLLSEKAEAIKNLNKTTKELIQKEEFKINGIQTANQKITEQIESLKKRQKLWTAKRNEDLAALVVEYDELSKIDIDSELKAHKDLTVYVSNLEKLNRYNSLLARRTAWRQKISEEISELERSLVSLSEIDIDAELKSHRDLILYNNAIKDRQMWEKSKKQAHDENLLFVKNTEQLTKEIYELTEHRCYACGQEFHDKNHNIVLKQKRKELKHSEKEYNRTLKNWTDIVSNEIIVPEKPTTHYKTETEAIRHSSEIESIRAKIASKKAESDPYEDQLAENTITNIGEMPKTHYDTEEEAIKHSGRVSSLLEQIERKHAEEDPYAEQIVEMQTNAIQTVDYTDMNNLISVLQHQDYLLDLLTNKKSFVRKKIIEQNLSYLNSRLTHYLDKIGLPHSVVFQNDLSVEITELGRDLDFDNLSRGERNRLILGLSFAFRDVYENLYHNSNLLFIDELIDNGMDSIGVENSLALLKDMTRRRSKSIWLVSHRDELINRVSSVLKVIKESGFTSFSGAVDVE
jgi:DNA repair exonuclease SbcCD ATPase subunit